MTKRGYRIVTKATKDAGGWNATVEVDALPGAVVRISVARGRRVRQAYGGGYGYKWHAYVSVDGVHSKLNGYRIPGSLGVRGILIDAEILPRPEGYKPGFLNEYERPGGNK